MVVAVVAVVAMIIYHAQDHTIVLSFYQCRWVDIKRAAELTWLQKSP